MKWVRRILLGLVSLIVIVIVLVFALSQRRLSRTFDVARAPLVLPTDAASLARGEHLGTAIGKCGGCHGDNLGGTPFIDDPAFGRYPAPNLTRGKGGMGTVLTDADFEAAIRHGVGPDGKSLVIMPAEAFKNLSNSDLASLVAWIRSRPPVDHEMASRRVGPVGRLLLAMHVPLLPAEQIDQQRKQPDHVEAAVTVEYGRYLTEAGGCRVCHNPSLSGGPRPGTKPPFPPNLTRGGLVNWTNGDFRRALREGRRPQGTPIDTLMPWRYTRLMTDDELDAMWMYLQSLPPKGYGKQ